VHFLLRHMQFRMHLAKFPRVTTQLAKFTRVTVTTMKGTGML